MDNSFAKIIMVIGALILGFMLIAFVFSASLKGNVPSAGSFLPNRGNIPSSNTTSGTGTKNTNNTSTSNNVAVGATTTSYRISISTGNASSEIQPAYEYITIKNNGKEPVDITGWTLKNGKGRRPIRTSDNTVIYEVADTLTIPKGIEFLDPKGNHFSSNIILMPTESAILITGKPFTQYRFSLPQSFKENICTGYLTTIDKYPFKVALTKSCPRLQEEEAAKYLTQTCYDYVKRLVRCDDPEETRLSTFELLEKGCQKFIKEYANYGSCVSLHGDDENFYSPKKWRVFLSKSFEMWARNNEKIILMDKTGRIVAERSY